MTDIGELKVTISADATRLESAMNRANAVVKQSTGQMGGAIQDLKGSIQQLLPAFSAVALVGFGKSALEAAAHIYDLSERIGFTANSLSALDIPLKQSGSSVDDFASSINLMNNSIGAAASGQMPELVKRFDSLGLSVTKLKSLTPEQQFQAIASALSKVDSQSQFIEQGRGIFGRGFASIGPLIKQIGGNLDEFARKATAAGDALTNEQLKRIDEFDDKWTATVGHLKIAMLGSLPVLKLYADGIAGILNLADNAEKAGEQLAHALGIAANPNVSTTRPASVNQVTRDPKAIQAALKARGLSGNLAAGSNADLLPAPKDSEFKQYISNLQAETAAIGQSERALTIARVEIEATAKAKEDFNNKTRSTKELLPEEKAQVDELAGSFYDLKKAQEETARFQQELHDKLSSTLTDIAFKAGSAKQSFLDLAGAIAKAAFEKKIAGPLADSLIGTNGKSGLLDGAISGVGSLFGGFFADGGSPPVGVPSIVGENGPEVFVPNTSGTIVPNGKIGGTTVIVQQTIQINPGVPELINARIREATPAIAALAEQSVTAGILKGGALSKIVGNRN
jgi:hypothetical protein